MLEKEKGVFTEVISLPSYFIKSRVEGAPVGENGT